MSTEKAPTWMKACLLAAAVYNLVWGAWVIVWPHAFFDWAGMQRLPHPEIWQCVGMIVGVYGIGYGIAAYDPARHWPIVLVGFLGKVFGPIGFLQGYFADKLPLKMGAVNITNDVIWWIPFALILHYAYRMNRPNTKL